MHAPTYHLMPADLRLSPAITLDRLLATGGPVSDTAEPILSPSLPTLLLFECVLVYMSPSHSSALLQWFVNYFSKDMPGLGSIVYEMFGLDDAFGRVMVNNLKVYLSSGGYRVLKDLYFKTRNVSLPGVAPYTTLGSLPGRFLDTGFTAAGAVTLREIRQDYIAAEELERWIAVLARYGLD